jgi:hypothetical protein
MTPTDPKRSDLDGTAYLGSKASGRSFSPVQLLFLLRLTKLLHDRQDWSKRPTADDWRLKLLNKAIYSTFCDCVELGVAEDARHLFAQSRSGNRA